MSRNRKGLRVNPNQRTETGSGNNESDRNRNNLINNIRQQATHINKINNNTSAEVGRRLEQTGSENNKRNTQGSPRVDPKKIKGTVTETLPSRVNPSTSNKHHQQQQHISNRVRGKPALKTRIRTEPETTPSTTHVNEQHTSITSTTIPQAEVGRSHKQRRALKTRKGTQGSRVNSALKTR